MKNVALVFSFLFLITLFVHAEEPLGITYSSGTADVRVWAPNAKSVSIVGDFNGWKPTRDDELVKDHASGIWSGSIRTSRTKGSYGFLINGEHRKRDPYGRAVSPNGRASVFYDPGAFDWGGSTSPNIALEDTVIYEMHVGTFNDPRPGDRIPATFDDVVKRLGYLSGLGVNTLCLLPIQEFNGKHSWGYNPSDIFAVEQTYGGPDALKRLVLQCHKRGIAVHLDVVHNHYGPENLDLLQFDGTGSQSSGGIYFYGDGDKAMTPWGPRVKYSDPMVRRFVRDNIMMWLEEYRVDGFRWDSTINIRAYNNGSRSIPEGLEMLEEINVAIHRKHPGKWSIAEDSYGIGNFDGSWDYDFHHQVMPVLKAENDHLREMYQIRSALTRQNEMQRVIYVDNHDEAGRLNGQKRIASDIDWAEPGGFHAKKLSGIGALLTLTAPGIPLLFMGNEFQEYGEFHDDNPLDWSKARLHKDLLTLHKDLISMRLNKRGQTPGLRGLGVEVPLVDNEKKGIVYWRWDDDTPADAVVIAINFSAVKRNMQIPFPSDGPWQMRVDTDWVRYGGGNRVETAGPFTLKAGKPLDVAMPAYSAKIYSLVNRPPKGTQRKTAKTPLRKTKKDRPPLSMYASINLVGNFNDWDLTAQPFKLVDDYIWEAEFSFDEVENPSFKLSANDNGVIYWGGYDGSLDINDGTSTQIKRLGKSFQSDSVWNGIYRIRFNEDLLFLEIEKTSDSTEDSGESDDGLRIWTDSRGAKIKARLVSAAGIMVSLEKENGQRIQFPANRFSEEDREYIEDWIDEFGD